MKKYDEAHLKSLTKSHYDKYTFIEPNIETNKKFIENNELFLNLLTINEMKEPIIEVGCGTGKYLKLIEMAGKKDIYSNNSFNTVICAGVAHHTPNPRKVFSECARVCRKKGNIIFAIYRKYSIYYWDYLFFNKINIQIKNRKNILPEI